MSRDGLLANEKEKKVVLNDHVLYLITLKEHRVQLKTVSYDFQHRIELDQHF